MFFKSLTTSLLLVTIFISCGVYSVKGSLPGHISSVALGGVENHSTEFGIDTELQNHLNETLVSENILPVRNIDNADSQIIVTIQSFSDKVHSYSLNETDSYENVEEWRITIGISVQWQDAIRSETLFDKKFSEFGAYGTGFDISNDQIDNDGDGLLDEADSDETGSPRESAIRLAIEKLTENIISEMTASW